MVALFFEKLTLKGVDLKSDGCFFFEKLTLKGVDLESYSKRTITLFTYNNISSMDVAINQEMGSMKFCKNIGFHSGSHAATISERTKPRFFKVFMSPWSFAYFSIFSLTSPTHRLSRMPLTFSWTPVFLDM